MGLLGASVIVVFHSLVFPGALGLHLWLKLTFQQLIVSSTKDLAKRFGIETDRIPVAILLTAVFLWWLPFYLSTITIAATRKGGFDNSHPRAMAERSSNNLASRLYAAHQNALEQLVFFGIALVFALKTAVGTDEIIHFGVLFIFGRVLFTLFYALNLDVFRSAVFFAAELNWVALLFFALLGDERMAEAIRKTTVSLALV